MPFSCLNRLSCVFGAALSGQDYGALLTSGIMIGQRNMFKRKTWTLPGMIAGFIRHFVSALTLFASLISLSVSAPALANEGAKSNSCPWAQDVSLEVNGKTMTLNQAMFAGPASEAIVMDPYKIYPLVDQLKLRIVGPKGREWEASLTRLVSGKRCSAFYVGKAFLVSDLEQNPDSLILNR